jgi:hypothetical protein
VMSSSKPKVVGNLTEIDNYGMIGRMKLILLHGPHFLRCEPPINFVFVNVIFETGT